MVINNLTLDLRSRSRKRRRGGSRRSSRRSSSGGTSLGNSNMAITSHGCEGVRRGGRLGRSRSNGGREDDGKLGSRGGNLLQDLGARTDATAEVEISGSLEADELLLSKEDTAQTLSETGGNVQCRSDVGVGEDLG